MAENGYITREAGRGRRKAKPLAVNIRAVRRAHLRRRVLRRGSAAHAARRSTARTSSTAAACRSAPRSIRSCSSCAPQGADRRPRRVRPQHAAGAGRSSSIDVAGDWGATLGAHRGAERHRSRGGSASCSRCRRPRSSSACGRRDSRTARSSTEREAVEIPFDEMKWAGKFIGTEAKGARRSSRPTSSPSAT